MSAALDEFRYKREDTTRRTISVALAFSVLVHVALLWSHLSLRVPSSEMDKLGKGGGPLSVRLAPLPRPLPAPPLSPPPLPRLRLPPHPVRPPKAAPRPPRPHPPILALKRPTPEQPKPKTPPFTVPTPRQAPSQEDLSSYIAAQRRARAEQEARDTARQAPAPKAPPVEDANERANRIAAANLALPNSKRTLGYDPKRGGGIFSISELGYDYAKFMFYGWNKDMNHNTAQMILVRKGSASDIRIAVVRKMIAIIREYEHGNFLWQSDRLGRTVTLSARPQDDAALEAFMMKEFFYNDPP